LSLCHREACIMSRCLQFGRAFAEGKYDWTDEGKQQLLLPSEYKKASAAKIPTPVISWHPQIINTCWKIACRLIGKLDEEKGVRRDFLDWVDTEVATGGDGGEVGAEAVAKEVRDAIHEMRCAGMC
jgi:hypothetical protein